MLGQRSLQMLPQSKKGLFGKDPEDAAEAIEEKFEPSLRSILGGNFYGGDGDPVATEDEKSNGASAGQMIGGGEEIDVVDIVLLKNRHETDEVGEGINGAVVEVEAGEGDACLLKMSDYQVGRTARGDPDGEFGVNFGKFCCCYFSFSVSAEDEDSLRFGGSVVRDRDLDRD